MCYLQLKSQDLMSNETSKILSVSANALFLLWSTKNSVSEGFNRFCLLFKFTSSKNVVLEFGMKEKS